uniref:L-gulonolactone oxidase n=1 Tax=Aegilops tauschii TaxID=37682 RepID=M8CNJ2_AEGTA
MAMELESPATTLLVVVGLLIHLAGSSPPPTPVVCARGTSDCTVTLALQPLFKRSLTFLERDDSDLEDQVAAWGGLHEFGDLAWQPGRGKVVYRQDDRVDVSSLGDGLNDHPTLRSRAAFGRVDARRAEELLEENGTDIARCEAAAAGQLQPQPPHGFTNDGEVFTGYPVVGYQHRMQATGTCIDSREDGLLTSCKWDPRLGATFIYNTAISVPLRNAAAFVADVKRLRDLNPRTFCSLDARGGLLARYIRASSAYLGKPEDAVDFDITYYRSYTAGAPRAHADVIDELEQMALHKYGGFPHWGKNRNFAFDGAVGRYPKAGEFLEVKGRYDPDGLFSSEWSDQVLGINGTSPSVDKEGCAMEGLCVCSDDLHCAPERGYLCRPGKACITDAVDGGHTCYVLSGGAHGCELHGYAWCKFETLLDISRLQLEANLDHVPGVIFIDRALRGCSSEHMQYTWEHGEEEEGEDEEVQVAAYTNNNYQAVNNSMLVTGSYAVRDPGVHVVIVEHVDDIRDCNSDEIFVDCEVAK